MTHREGVMKRLQFLAGLLGIGVAAKGQIPQSSENVIRTAWSDRNPTNNQCPVCGTMAEPFHRPTFTKNDGYEPVPGQPYMVHAINQREEPYGPIENLTRCKRCSVAFWQDEAK